MLYQVIEGGQIVFAYILSAHNDTKHIGSAKRGDANGVAELDSNTRILNNVLPGMKQQYLISNDIFHSHDADVNTTSTTYVKLKTITINTLYQTPVTIRVFFRMWAGFSGGDNAYGRIYKNGVPFGTERISTVTLGTDYVEDLEFANGDTLELWGKRNAGITDCNMRNFRVFGTAINVPLQDALDTNPGEAVPFIGSNS